MAPRCLSALLLGAVFALATASPAFASRELVVGVVDDWVKWRADTPGIVRVQREAGFDTAKVTFPWHPGQWHPGGYGSWYVQRISRMSALGQRVVVAFSGSDEDAPRTPATRQQFCSYVRSVLAQLPEVQDVVIWNEVNSPAFWRPQHDAPEKYAALLARCWDVLHAMRPDVNVISSTAPRHGPLEFLRQLGAAHAASGRTRPIVPFQTSAPFRGLYHGRETETKPLRAGDQARQLVEALKLAYCSQPLVGAFFNFQLADERRLGGWQSGLLWANWRPKPSRGPVRDVIHALRTRTLACV